MTITTGNTPAALGGGRTMKKKPAKRPTMKDWEASAEDRRQDAARGDKEGSKKDKAQDRAGLAKMRAAAKKKAKR